MDFDEFLLAQHAGIPSQIDSYRQTGTLFEGGRMVDFILCYSKSGKFRADVKIDNEIIYSEGFDGEYAWDSDQALLGDPALSLENSVRWPNPIRSLQVVRDEGHKLTWHGLKELHQQDLVHLTITLNSGSSREYYYDPETCLLQYTLEQRKLEATAKPKIVETAYTDYRDHEGASFAYHLLDQVEDDEKAIVDIQWNYTTINPVLDSNHFTREYLPGY